MRRWLHVVLIAGLAATCLAACDSKEDASAPTAPDRETPVTTGRVPNSSNAPETTGVATRAQYLAAIERSMSTGDALVVTMEQAECVAPRWLDIIGLDRLIDHGVAPPDIGDDRGGDGSTLADLELSHEHATALVDAFGDCDADLRTLFLDLMTEGEPTDLANCIDERLTAELVQRMMVSSILEDHPNEQLQADIDVAIDPCADRSAQATSPTTG